MKIRIKSRKLNKETIKQNFKEALRCLSLKYIQISIVTNKMTLSSIIRIFLILLLVLNIGVLSRLLVYGIPLETINFADIIISTQSFLFRHSFGLIIIFILIYGCVLFLSYFDKHKTICFLVLTIFMALLYFYPEYDLYSFTLISFILFLDVIFHYKKRLLYIKYMLLMIIFYLLISIFSEGLNQFRFYINLYKGENFTISTIFEDITHTYILEYKKPYIAEVKIDKNKPINILILGFSNGYIFYHTKQSVSKILNKIAKNKITKNKTKKICNNNLLYPQSVIETLKTTELKNHKFERKKIDIITIITEYISFNNSFCKGEAK